MHRAFKTVFSQRTDKIGETDWHIDYARRKWVIELDNKIGIDKGDHEWLVVGDITDQLLECLPYSR
jgi:hypothetical protein